MDAETQGKFDSLIETFGEDPQNESKLYPVLQRTLFTTETGYRMLGHPYVHGMFASWKEANRAYDALTKIGKQYLKEKRYDAWLSVCVQKPYRLEYLDRLFRSGRIDVEQLRKSLAWVWTNAEPDDTNPRWLRLFEDAGWTSDEYESMTWASVVPVYRGQETMHDGFGIAWSTDVKVAEFFATRWGRPGIVIEGKVSPSKVLGWLTNRNESEVIIDPVNVLIVDVRKVESKRPSPLGEELEKAIQEGRQAGE